MDPYPQRRGAVKISRQSASGPNRVRPETSPTLRSASRGGRRALGGGVRIGLAIGFLLTLSGSAPTPSALNAAHSGPIAACETSALARIESVYQRWLGLLERRDELSEEDFERQADALVTDAFALEVMGAKIFKDKWDKLGEHRREEFLVALTRSLRTKLVSYFTDVGEVPQLRPADEEPRVRGDFLEARYWLVKSDWSDWLSLRIMQRPQGSCGIYDIRHGDEKLLGDLRERVGKLAGDYSFPYMIAEVGDYGFVALEDFESSPEGELPLRWTWRGKDDDENKPYRVKVENGNKYLEATDEGESVIIGREIKWNLNEYPYISFRVRVNQIPVGGDERDSRKVDSAAGLYFTYKKKVFGKIPESAKYVWSSTLPVGSAVRREGIGRPWQIVFGSGKEGLGEWRTYTFDLRQAYRDTFGGKPSSKTVGIGVLSDANSLKAKAYADYDDIRALRTAPSGVTSGVKEILAPVGHE